MKVKLIGKKRVISLILPQKVYGSYWITSEDNENLINIEAIDNKWVMKSNSDVKILEESKIIDSKEVIANHFYTFLNVTTNEKYRVFVGEPYDSKMLTLDFVETEDIAFFIGNSNKTENGNSNYISYENENLHLNQIKVVRTKGYYYLKNLYPEVKMFVNNYLTEECFVSFGDIIFIEGFTFSFVGNKISFTTVDNKVKYATNKFNIFTIPRLDYSIINRVADQNIEMYSKNDYFVRPPRFNTVIETKNIDVNSPPKKQENETLPIILTLGPMLVMGMGSSVTGVMALIKVLSGKESFSDNLTSILTAFSMLVAMFVFPFASKLYQKRRAKKKEELRQKKYKEYLQKIDAQIKDECLYQKRVLVENNIDLNFVGDIILYKKRNLWERKLTHPDFLDLRLGTGNVIPKINVNYQKEQFTLEEDNLETELRSIIKNNSIIENVPVTHSFRQKYISALIGKESVLKSYIEGLILQMVAYHSFDELKIVIFTNINNVSYWEKYKNTPYCWKNDKTIRYFGTTIDEISVISAELENEFQARSAVNTEANKDVIYGPHYLIITDDVYMVSKVGIINDILKSKKSYGFSLLYLTDKLNSLPSECSSFINIDNTIGGIFENELINKKQEFIPSFVNTLINPYLHAISNIPIELGGAQFELPKVYTFLEMYDVGNVEQLNSYNRWQKNDPTTSLSCPVGINENGDLFKLDLHEKVHGPHGLVAGMTGSGKSEFIITYILSMAVNYAPDEVQFVLIDYKGGGLAGAFENRETGVKLPHLAGVITNLDVSEINRSLASLQSELKRRQKIFNEARDACNESTVDIYKYQKLYRDGKVKEPVAHLMIISDEFAELKSQQPEFMDELISAARIGRSLGVHLVLATQKPSGVVDDQIWSNSKFRVCLKVQDKSDSNDMIKSPEAAYIKETGRFILQVGFNEFFAKGQSAWCGASYYESEKRKKLIDTSVTFVDNVGSVIKSVDNDKSSLRGVHKGEELSNVLKYIEEIGKKENYKVRQLWLNAIPAYIFINGLKEKYNFQKDAFVINPIIGEYDAPNEQRQAVLTLPLTNEGNCLIYGAVGSGKENLISTIIYSLITSYTVDEVNIYVLDFGSEALKMYSKAPHVSGILNSSEKDKVLTLIRVLKGHIETRKKLFAEYNGNFQIYNAKSGKTVPAIITLINGFESFNELYPEVADDLVLLTREGAKYGVIFVNTVSATNNIRTKLSQNFNIKLTLQMNDDFDYRQILGRTELLPSKISGRGLVKLDNIYEFQSAYPSKLEDLNTFIKEEIDKLNSMYPKKAPKLPSLPDIVTLNDIIREFKGLNSLPVGIEKQDLNIVTIDLKSQLSLMVSASKIDVTKKFMQTLIYEVAMSKNTNVLVIDAEHLISSAPSNVTLHSNAFDKVFTNFKTLVEQMNDEYTKSDYNQSALDKYNDTAIVISGIYKLKSILGSSFDELVATPLMMSKKLSKMCYIFVDTFDNYKKMEYDLWYKDIINSTRGIWIGNGLAEQSVFKLYSSAKSISNTIPNNFGYNIVSGIPTLFKYVEDYNLEDVL